MFDCSSFQQLVFFVPLRAMASERTIVVNSSVLEGPENLGRDDLRDIAYIHVV